MTPVVNDDDIVLIMVMIDVLFEQLFCEVLRVTVIATGTGMKDSFNTAR
jgi:hypothetical protein